MDLIALALVLVAACVHAAWNYRLHGIDDRLATLAVAGLASAVLLSPTVVISPPRQVLPLIVLSALIEVAYALCLSAAYSRGALSLAYPIGRGTAPLLVTLGGWLVLTERPTPLTIVGALALAAGLTLVASTAHGTAGKIAVGFALLTGVSIAAYSLIDAQAVRHASPAGYLGAVLGLEGILLTIVIRGDRVRLRQALGPGLRIAAGSIAAYLLVLLAFQRTGAGRVATLREVSVIIGLLIAREKPGRRAWIGAILVLAGAVLAAV